MANRVGFWPRLGYSMAMMTKSHNSQSGHSDMRQNGWWRHLPHRWHPYIYLGRFDRPIGWWLLLLPAWWIIPVGAASTNTMFLLMALFWIGALITRAAGCIVNDLWDRRLDQQVERTQQRPLASGAISVVAALGFLLLLGLIGLGVLWQLPQNAIYVGLAATPLVILYPLAKRVTWFPQFVLGLTFSWGVPLGWTAATGILPDNGVLLIYAGTVAWIFGYDTIYAVQDMVDDAAIGVKSSALAFAQNLKFAVGTAYALALLLWSWGFLLKLGFGWWLIGLCFMGVHLAHQLRQLDRDNPALALRLFQSNRDAGLILVLTMLAVRLFG